MEEYCVDMHSLYANWGGLKPPTSWRIPGGRLPQIIESILMSARCAMFMVLVVFVLMLMTMVMVVATVADVFTHMALIPWCASRAHSITIAAIWYTHSCTRIAKAFWFSAHAII